MKPKDKEQAAYREEARELMRQVQEKASEYDPDRKVRFSAHACRLQHCSLAAGFYHYRVHCGERDEQHRPSDRLISSRLAGRRYEGPAWPHAGMGSRAWWFERRKRVKVRLRHTSRRRSRD